MTPAAPHVVLPWIVRLRYAMAAGQILTAWVVDRVLAIDLPLAWIAAGPAVVVATNLWLARQRAPRIGWFFLLDTLCLTAVLMLSGGPNNPFSLLYLVHITLSAAILTQRQTWALGALSTACFGALFVWYRPIRVLEMHQHGEGVNLHLTGMWIGFAAAAFLVAMFAGKISALLREMQEELARKERLASLVTLAAGAAHELNTPLGTIAVVARELERSAAQAQNAAMGEDSRLIRAEVERCRAILQRMSASGAEPACEVIRPVRVSALASSVDSPQVKVEIEPGADVELAVPSHAVQQALAAMVRNGVDAGGAPVHLEVRRQGGFVQFRVRDSGQGIPAETLRHVGEPFFTTKEPGKGMGLGIFLVRTLAERLGGRFTLESTPGQGTQATLELPC